MITNVPVIQAALSDDPLLKSHLLYSLRFLLRRRPNERKMAFVHQGPGTGTSVWKCVKLLMFSFGSDKKWQRKSTYTRTRLYTSNWENCIYAFLLGGRSYYLHQWAGRWLSDNILVVGFNSIASSIAINSLQNQTYVNRD